MVVDAGTFIGDLLQHTGCVEVLRAAGLVCTGCPAAQGETIREACAIHDIDENTLLEQLRRAVASGH